MSQKFCKIFIYDNFLNKLQELKQIVWHSSLHLLLVLIVDSLLTHAMLQQPRGGKSFSRYISNVTRSQNMA